MAAAMPLPLNFCCVFKRSCHGLWCTWTQNSPFNSKPRFILLEQLICQCSGLEACHHIHSYSTFFKPRVNGVDKSGCNPRHNLTNQAKTSVEDTHLFLPVVAVRLNLESHVSNLRGRV